MVAKGEEAKVKKRNKAIRRRVNRDPATAVSARVAAIIAAKKRRHTGKRRQCQGMCFSLPTPEDPFNDRRFKDDSATATAASLNSKTKNNNSKKSLSKVDIGCPSKFVFSCLNSIRDFMVVGNNDDGKNGNGDNSLIASKWGFEFWKSYTSGNDVCSGSGTSGGATVEQIAWIASTAADSIQRIETELHTNDHTPFLLYLVPSQDRAVQVRSVCKPLKVLGIHTVSLHAGSSVEHQVNGLKSCDPEFVVATPERLWELITLQEIDISAVTLLVVDAMDSLSNCFDIVKLIKSSISGNLRTVLFNGCSSNLSIQAKQLQSILRKPVDKLSLDDTTGRQRMRH